MSRVLLLAAFVTSFGALASRLPATSTDDAERALAALTEAADAGDVHALQDLAEARRRGYVQTPSESGRTQTNLPVWSWPGQAWVAQRRFERVLRDSARAGHPDALYLVAGRLLHPWRSGQDVRSEPTVADRDSAAALFVRLTEREPSSLRLAFLAKQLRRDADYERLLTEAAEREPQACAFHLAITFRHTGSDAPLSTAEHAAFLDASARCAELFDAHGIRDLDPGAAFVAGLAEQTASGNAEAAALLDGLRAEGVFERHPRLGAVLDAHPEADRTP